MTATRKIQGGGRRLSMAALATLAATVVAAGVVAPAAQAASYTYANAISTAEGVARDSGIQAVISGGTAKLSVTFGQSWIVTYRPAPGYSEIGFAVGDNPQVVRLGHQDANNVHSKCYWSFPSVGGTAELTCTYTN